MHKVYLNGVFGRGQEPHLYKGIRNDGFAYGVLNYVAVNWEFSLYVRKIQPTLSSV